MADTNDKAERRRKRRRRWAWGVAVATAVTAVVWIGSVFYSVEYVDVGRFTFGLGSGVVSTSRYEFDDAAKQAQILEGLKRQGERNGWWAGADPPEVRALLWSPRFLPESGSWYHFTSWIVPLWPLVAALGTSAIVLFRLSRPPRPGLCPSCGYDLAGLGKGARCPECGGVHGR